MKKLILAAIAFTSVVTANAQAEIKTTDTTAIAKVVSNKDDQRKVEVKINELPSAVQTAIKSDQFKGWEAKKAYIVKGDPTTYYEVEMVNAKTEKNVVKFNENGTVID